MVFQQDKETGEYIALILEDGIQKTYGCTFEACKNPICSCRTVDVILAPVQDNTRQNSRLSSRRVEIDLIEKSPPNPLIGKTSGILSKEKIDSVLWGDRLVGTLYRHTKGRCRWTGRRKSLPGSKRA